MEILGICARKHAVRSARRQLPPNPAGQVFRCDLLGCITPGSTSVYHLLVYDDKRSLAEFCNVQMQAAWDTPGIVSAAGSCKTLLTVLSIRTVWFTELLNVEKNLSLSTYVTISRKEKESFKSIDILVNCQQNQ